MAHPVELPDNSSIILIALDIFRRIHLDPLTPANTNYLLMTTACLLGFERQVDDACALIGLHPDSIRIQVANRTPDRETRSWASTLGDLNVSRQTNLARFDVSVFDGPDVLAGDDDVARLDALEAVVFPEGRGEDLGKASDIDILDAHLRSKAEHFVTRDRHLLHPRDELRRMFGIVVLTPAEALADLDRQD